jgi:hypothetical protein
MREGADVLIAYLNEDQDAAEVAGLVEDAGRRCVPVPGYMVSRGLAKSGSRHHDDA